MVIWKCFYIHNNRRAHHRDLPIRVRLFLTMQLVDNCLSYRSCRCRVSWDLVLHIDSPRILDKQMRYNTKQLMQGWWTEMINGHTYTCTSYRLANYIFIQFILILNIVDKQWGCCDFPQMQLRHLFMALINACITGLLKS